jgi:hypothetical protein
MTPLEKMARAIVGEFEKRGTGIELDGGTWLLESYIDPHSLAKAALQSLLPPDEGTVEAMVNAMNHAFECSVCGCDVPGCGCGHESWQEASSFKKARAALSSAINSILKGEP